MFAPGEFALEMGPSPQVDMSSIENARRGDPTLQLTDYLAIYAAVISTSVFAWNIVQSWPRIKIDLIDGVEESGDNIRHGVYIFVRNVSFHVVYLSAIDVRYPYRRVGWREWIAHMRKFRRLPRRLSWVQASLSRYSIENGCPVRLDAQCSHKIFLGEEMLERLFSGATERTLIACAQDQLWNDFYSRTFQWLGPSRE